MSKEYRVVKQINGLKQVMYVVESRILVWGVPIIWWVGERGWVLGRQNTYVVKFRNENSANHWISDAIERSRRDNWRNIK